MIPSITLNVPSDLLSTAHQDYLNQYCIFSGDGTIPGTATDPQNGEQVSFAPNTVTEIEPGQMVQWKGECSDPNPNDVTVDIMYINHSADSLFRAVGSGIPKTITLKVRQGVTIGDGDEYSIFFRLSSWPDDTQSVQIDPKMRVKVS